MTKKVEKKVEIKEVVNKENNEVLDELQAELRKMREELKELRTEKKSLSDAEKAAVEAARDEMITDDDIGILYIDEKYKEEGYHYRIVDSTRMGRIPKLLKLGYEIVYDADAKIGNNSVKSTANLTDAVTVPLSESRSQLGVLMRCPLERYDARQALKTKRTKELDAAMLQEAVDKSDFGTISIGDEVYKK